MSEPDTEGGRHEERQEEGEREGGTDRRRKEQTASQKAHIKRIQTSILVVVVSKLLCLHD